MDVALEAVRRGIIAKEDAPRVGPDQARILNMMIGLMDMEEIQDHSVCEFDVEMYSQEVLELGDILDLQECDKVECGKTFEHDEVAVNVPVFLIPFMRNVVLPAIREAIQGVDN